MRNLKWMILTICFVFGLTAMASSTQIDNSPAAQKYRSAYGLVLEGKWDEADAALEAFLQAFKGSKWTDDASFWRCYIHSRKSQDKEVAFSCFENFANTYPRSSYTKDAQAEMVMLARDLVKLGKPEYEEKVRDLRQSQEKETTLMVLYALRDIGDTQAWDALIDYFDNSDDERIRKAIVSMLDDFDNVDAIGVLKRIFRKDSSELVRRQAIRTLKEFNQDPEVINFLKKVVLDERESMSIRKSAIRQLGDVEGHNLLAFFEKLALQGSRDLARSAVNLIGDSQAGANWEVLQRIYTQSTNLDVKRRVLSTLGDKFGPRALDFLTDASLNGEIRELRRTAIRTLANIKHPSVLQRLQKIITNATDLDTRKYGLRAIGELKGEKPTAALKDFLFNNSEPQTRREAAYALAKLAGADAIPHLKRVALEDNNFDVRRYAIKALRDIKDPKAALALIEILKATSQNR